MRAFRTVLRWLAGFCSAIGVLFLIATLTPIDYWWATTYAGRWDDPKGDVLVVLTGSLLDERTIGLNSYWRGVYAARVFESDGFKEIIVSGGGDDVTPISGPMRDFIVFLGVPADRVRMETASHTTHTSAVEVAKILSTEKAAYEGKRIVLLTSDYHMFRAYRAFRRAGIDVAPRPFPDIRKRYGALEQRWTLFVELLAETAKIAYYWTRGWI